MAKIKAKTVNTKAGDELYTVLIGEGEGIRHFNNLKLLCSLMHLDHPVIKRILDERGFWTGLGFSVWRGVMETNSHHRGYY